MKWSTGRPMILDERPTILEQRLSYLLLSEIHLLHISLRRDYQCLLLLQELYYLQKKNCDLTGS